jgi:hypothetical protein
VTALAASYGLGLGALVAVGWAGLAFGAGLLSINLLASLRAAPTALALSARLIAVAQGCLLVALAIALAHALTHDPMSGLYGTTRTVMAVLLLPGWLGLTVAGALLHLLAVLARVRDLTQPLPTARPVQDVVVSGAAVLGVLTLAAGRAGVLPGSNAPALAILVSAYLVLSALVVARLARAVGAHRRRRARAL